METALLRSRALILSMTAILYAMSAPEASAFDGHRRGFTLGFHVGALRLDRVGDEAGTYTVSSPDTAGSGSGYRLEYLEVPANPASGFTTQFKLGFGLSESVRLCYTAQTDLVGSSSVVFSDGGSGSGIEGGSATLTLDYYPGGASGKWFGSAGAGVGTIEEYLQGPAYHLSVGWDFWRGAQLQCTVSRYGTTNRHNHSARLLLGWMWD